jgi:hypothetical protein
MVSNGRQFLLQNGYCCESCSHCFKNYYGDGDDEYKLYCDITMCIVLEKHVCEDCDMK